MNGCRSLTSLNDSNAFEMSLMPIISERIWYSTLDVTVCFQERLISKITDLSYLAASITSLSRARLHREDGRDGLKAFNQAAGPFPVLHYDFMENTLRDKDLYI